MLIEYLLKILLAAFPSVGFAMLFSVPKKYLIFCAIGGMITYATKIILMVFFDAGVVSSTFVATTLMSLMFIGIAPLLKVPRPVFTVASIIPIIPGKYAYLTLLNGINIYNGPGEKLAYIEEFFSNGVTTGSVMLAMGLGIALPPLFFYRNHPVV